jgi:hypothetical protein
MNALISASVLADAIQNREPYAEEARTLIRAAANQEFSGYITAEAVIDLYRLVYGCTHSCEESRKILSKILFLFPVIDTTEVDVKCAMSSDLPYYETAVMAESAMRKDVDCMILRDPRGFDSSPVPVYSPGEFLNILSKM